MVSNQFSRSGRERRQHVFFLQEEAPRPDTDRRKPLKAEHGEPNSLWGLSREYWNRIFGRS